jgi:hypothetical protein
MVRIPYTYNSKLLNIDTNPLPTYTNTDPQVNIIQKWNGIRPKINLLLGLFHAFLVNKILKENQEKDNRHFKKYIQYNQKFNYPSYSSDDNKSEIMPWIELRLNLSIEDYRKNAMNLILSPYLITVRKHSFEQSYTILKVWLQNCDKIRRLDFNIHDYIKLALCTSIKKGIPPMKLTTLKEKNLELYLKLYKQKCKV